MKPSSKHPTVAVLGAGSFGTAVANLISDNCRVYLYTRSPEKKEQISSTGFNYGQKLNERVIVSNDLEMITEQCKLLFPVIPSANFRDFIKRLCPLLKPDHILIHGTKGFDISKAKVDTDDNDLLLSRKDVATMSEVIQEETNVLQIGALAGPNLSSEIAQGQPTAAVIASPFKSVIREGTKVLKSRRFMILSSHDMTGIETAGVLKNIMAIGAGILHGMGMGNNTRAMLISRGLTEMIRIGDVMGSDTNSFLGVAGIGDLIATCSSNLSRNFTVGYWLAKGKELPDILNDMNEVAEGIKTVMISKALANQYKIHIPITDKIFQILFKELPAAKAINQLMDYRDLIDADFMEQ